MFSSRGKKTDSSHKSSKSSGKGRAERDDIPAGSQMMSAAADTTTEHDYASEELGFLWSIDALHTTYENHMPRRLTVNGHHDVAFYWFPPTRKSQFKVIKKGAVYRWRAEGSKKVESMDIKDLRTYSTSSVFFQSRQDNFVASNTDCTQKDVRDVNQGWCQIGFNHEGNLSAVDLIGDKFGLGGSAVGTSWMPQVLPRVYDCHTAGEADWEGLCGRLSLMIGMAAFSTDYANAEEIVAKCFQLGNWKSHGAEIGSGRHQERGVVATIYYDPSIPSIRSSQLKALEKGKYGPIFPNKPSLQHGSYNFQRQVSPLYSLQSIPRQQSSLLTSMSAAPYTFNPSAGSSGSTFTYSAGHAGGPGMQSLSIANYPVSGSRRPDVYPTSYVPRNRDEDNEDKDRS